MNTRISLILAVVFSVLLSLSIVGLAYNEAPMLEEKVADGDLPRIEERLPETPLEVEPVERIGEYGGTLDVMATDKTQWNDLLSGIGSGEGLLDITPEGELVPNLAKDWEATNDYKTFHFYLREGLKWSDGEPFTVDDILFLIEDIFQNEDLHQITPGYLMAGDEYVEATKVDKYTLKLDFAKSYPSFPIIMATPSSWQYLTWTSGMYAPKHYLKKWHIEYNSEAKKLADKEGYDSWTEAFNQHANWINIQTDIDLPVLQPWTLSQDSESRRLYVRNPYYWQVDPEGNQLPYVDKVNSIIVGDSEVYNLKAVGGEADFAMMRLNLGDYPMYKQNEEKGDYTIKLATSGIGNAFAIGFNQAYQEDDILQEIFQDKRFRQAMSLAIDRKEINDVVFFDRGVPRQNTINPDAIFFKSEWAEAYADYNPEKASNLLDEMGLDEKNENGYRLRPDGEPLSIVFEYWEQKPMVTDIMQLVQKHWKEVGVEIILKNQPRNLLSQRAGKLQATGWQVGKSSEFRVYSGGGSKFGPGGGEFGLSLWSDWLGTDGKQGVKPPESIIEYDNLLERWTKETAYRSEEYKELGEEVFDTFSQLLPKIGTVGLQPGPILIKNNLKNVPIPGTNPESMQWRYGPAVNRFRQQFFFEK